MSLAEDIPPAAPRFDNAEAFLDWAEVQPERWELWDGVARMVWDGSVQMMTGGSRNHMRLWRNALNAIMNRMGDGSCEVYGNDFPVRLGDARIVYPDLSVSCVPEDERGLAHPVVVIEVLSPSTAAYDQGDKAAAYRRLASLRHLVLVHQDRVGVEHFHREAEGEDFILTEIDQVDGVLALTAIGVEIALADLYARVTFAA